jgi:hypothetical protein
VTRMRPSGFSVSCTSTSKSGSDSPGLLAARDDILAPDSRSWAPAASALVLVAAQTTDETGRTRPWALDDTGQAVAALSVQA